MWKKLPRPPSPALIVSIVALFVALGGTSYAMVALAPNSVGTKELKDGAVTTKKIKNGAIIDRKIARGTITGDRIDLRSLGTVPSANNANTAGVAFTAAHANAADVANGQGTLRSGASESGVWASAGGAHFNYPSAVIAFPVPLAAGLDANHAIYVTTGSVTHCAGAGHADPGYLCVYAGEWGNLAFRNFVTPEGNGQRSSLTGGAAPTGTIIYFCITGTDPQSQDGCTASAAPGNNFADGVWTVTAP